MFLTVLSASIIAIALLADATGFGPETMTLALVLLPVVFLLGLLAYVRLVQINVEEIQLVLAMNRLRRAYMEVEPSLGPYFTTGFHDDAPGIAMTYMLDRPSRHWIWLHFVVNTPTIIATVDATLAAAVAVLLVQLASLAPALVVAAGGAAFLAVWIALYLLQLHSIRRLLHQPPRFPDAAGEAKRGRRGGSPATYRLGRSNRAYQSPRYESDEGMEPAFMKASRADASDCP